MHLKIITNIERLGDVQLDNVTVDTVLYPDGMGLVRAGWYVFKKSFGRDYVVINCSTPSLCILGLLNLVFPFNRCRLVSVDSVLPVPGNTREKIRVFIIALCFKGVDIFLDYFKDTSGVEKYYGVKKSKFRYIPFKINRYERVLEIIENNEIDDEGYIFCGGNTRRDFDTLIEAARRFSYPVKILTMGNSLIQRHGSYLDETSLPDNIEVIRHDGSDTFLDYIAKARIVVLPIKKRNITASGIGVSIAAMGLKKCVIISSGPSVNDIISDEAIVIPPENPEALAQEIKKAYENDEYQSRAHSYAMQLGGEKKLYQSIIEQLVEDKKNT